MRGKFDVHCLVQIPPVSFQPDALTTAAAWDDVQAELSSAVDLLDEAMAGGGAGCDLVEAHRKSVRAAQVLLDEAFEIGSAQS